MMMMSRSLQFCGHRSIPVVDENPEDGLIKRKWLNHYHLQVENGPPRDIVGIYIVDG